MHEIRTALIPAGHRDWQRVEILGEHVSGRTIVREIGKYWRGVALVERCDLVRVETADLGTSRSWRHERKIEQN